jgi:hypothetical protein
MYMHVFHFLFCTRRKREKVAQARTWFPAMCVQKGNQRAAKPLGRIWDSNTRLHSDMWLYVPLSQLWLWHYDKFVGIYTIVKDTYTYRQYIHIHTYTYRYMHIHAYTDTYMHVPITVGRGLWGAVADALCLRKWYNFPNRLWWGLGLGQQARIRPGTAPSRVGWAVQGPPTAAEGGGARNGVVGGHRDGVKKYWRPCPGLPWVRPAWCRHRRQSLGDMAVIIVCAAAIQANTPSIHSIQADTDDTHNTGIYIQYKHIHAMANQRKTIFFDLVARTLSKFSLPRNLTSTFGAEYILKNTYTYRQYKHIHTHTNSIVCDMYPATSYNKIHTIHTNTGHIHTRKTGLKKNELVYVKACICMYLSVFELYLKCILYVFCLFCMYLAECVCIDATSNFSCRKYMQIHTIQTNTGKYRNDIHTQYIHKYIQNTSVSMCMYAHVSVCICLYIVCMYVFFYYL